MVGGGVGDHEGVVGEKIWRRKEEFEIVPFGLGGEGLAEGGVGADAAADGDGAAVGLAGGFEEFGGEDIDYGGLDGGAEVREIRFSGWAVFFEEDADRGFEAAEAEIEIARVDHAAREIVSCGIAVRSEAVDEDAAGIAEAEEFGGFVEGLAGGVVEGAAEELVFSEAFDIQKQSVTATDDECGVGWDGVAPEERREQVALDVVHGEEGFGRTKGQALGEGRSDKQGGGQARAGGGGDGIKFGKIEAGFLHGAVDDWRGAGEVVARGDLRNDAAELGMNFGLTENLVRAHLAKSCQNGGSGFVARAFNGKDRGHSGQLFLAWRSEPWRASTARSSCGSQMTAPGFEGSSRSRR